jgi:hypothetical protein
MFWLLILIAMILMAVLLVQIYWVWMFRKAQKQYLQDVKEHGRPTMWDVREALKEGDRDMAVNLYCEVFGIEDIERARKEVEDMERGLKH